MKWVSEWIRLYTLHSPIDRGRGRIATLAARLAEPREKTERVHTVDGRTLVIDSNWASYRLTYFTGRHDDAITRVLAAIIRPGDICIDAGAHLGWHTTLLAARSGGSVHAFEPMPEAFARLKTNLDLNDWAGKVSASRVALSDRNGTEKLHLFRGLPEGHASISDMGRTDFDLVTTPVMTLDSYLMERCVGPVDVIKIDVEGSELALLRGATSLFSQARPPLMVIEMAVGTLSGFGLVPNDLLEFIDRSRPYEFFAVDERHGHCRPLRRFPQGHPGADVLCVPSGFFADRVAGLTISHAV